MIQLVLKPHRDSLQAATAELQKLFVLLKVIPAGQLSRARPPFGAGRRHRYQRFDARRAARRVQVGAGDGGDRRDPQ